MKTGKSLLALAAVLALSTAAWAAQSTMPAHSSHMASGHHARMSKTHEAAGTIASFDATHLVLNQMEKGKETTLAFVLNPSTQREGKLEVGESVRVDYRVENNENVATKIAEQSAKKTAPEKSSKPRY